MKKNKTGTEGKSGGGSLKDIQIPNWAAVALIAVMIAVFALVFILSQNKGGSTKLTAGEVNGTTVSGEADPNANEVQVLPETVRNFGGADVTNPFLTESLNNVRVTGVISNSDGKYTAIIETDASSYVVGVGDTIPGSAWSVSEITGDSVTFSGTETKKTIYMNAANGTNTAASNGADASSAVSGTNTSSTEGQK